MNPIGSSTYFTASPDWGWLIALYFFFGGLAGGWVAEHFGATAVFAGCAAFSALWLAAASAMRPPGAPVNELSRATL